MAPRHRVAVLMARPRFSLPVCALLAAAHVPAQQREALAADAMAIAFPHGERVERRVVALTDAQLAAVAARTGLAAPNRIFTLWVGRAGDEVTGYAVVDDVRGKAQPITFLLAVDRALTVRAVEILAYRESHGGEIRAAGWRDQFVGRGPDDPLRVGHDVANIAGATISVRAVTDGVRRALAYLAVLVPPGSAVPAPAAPAPAAAPAAGTAAPAPDAMPLRRSRLAMGTVLEVVVYAADAARATAAADAAFAEVARCEAVLSTFIPTSALSVLNDDAGRLPRPRDPLLVDFLAQSQDLSRATGGALDVTVGPLVELWRRAAAAGHEPTACEQAAARACCGPEWLLVDAVAGTAGLARAGARIDPGAVGKGYALDRAAAQALAHGATAVLLNFGGQLLAAGTRPDGGAWPVRLRDADGGLAGEELALRAGSVSTTADYERGLRIDGKLYSHIVDPHTGRPVEGMRAVTVHAATGTAADALSTALYALGFARAVAFARERDLAASIHAEAGDAITPSFRALCVGGER